MIHYNAMRGVRRALVYPLFVATVALGLSGVAWSAATVTIFNDDGPGVGFNDSTPAMPVGGNTGTTRGQQRLIAFQHAAGLWGATLDSAVPIVVRATWAALTCTSTTAVLGSAGAQSNVANFSNAPFTGTNYSIALANKLAGSDLNGSTYEINAQFNVNLGNPGCLDGSPFYLGLDGNEGAGVDLVAVLTHEMGHGLGFQTFTSGSTGAQSGGRPTIYDRFLIDGSTGKSWLQMTNAERAASAINPRKLAWTGPTVGTDAPSVLQLGTPFMFVNAPAAVTGTYDVGAASFGDVLTTTGVTGNVVMAAPAEACTAITNGAALAGNIALIDRGTCGFVVKVKAAQDAGAIAVLVADNAVGSPPAGLGGSDPTITIPSVRITQADGIALKAQLANTVNVTLKLDDTVRAGADMFGKPLMFSPNPFQSGSSVSHWDTSTTPNQLMEPAINGDLTQSLVPPQDLTRSLMRDIGWVSTPLPSSIAKTAGDLQVTAPNQPLATAPSVTVSPAVAGLTVTWTVNTSSAASASFPSTSSRFAVSTTNASGVATAPPMTANAGIGAYSMNATVPGAGTTTFTLSNAGATGPDLTISKFHVGSLARSFAGGSYSSTVTNTGTAAKIAGQLVTVTEVPPSGLTITRMEGLGWTCTTLPSCTRSDALAAGASYPQVAVTVSVAADATSPQNNVINVSTAATELSTANNSFTDPTVIVTTTTFPLTVAKAGSGSGIVTSAENWISCGPTCTAPFANGSQVQLTAQAAGGSTFTGWLGACTGNASTCSLAVGAATNVTATFATSPVATRILDADDNNAYEPQFDGVLILRHLFGLTGSALTNGATGTGANPARIASPALRNYLIDVLPYFDVDGDGQVLPLTDGLMLMRKLLGLTDTAVTNGAIGLGATRTPAEIDAYIQTLRP